MFSKNKIQELTTKFSQLSVSSIKDSELSSKALALKAKQSGFTLLELLVIVAILAAVAGTTTVALKDTDARASAAAHVAMMDELNKGIGSFRVINRNAYPTNFDSLMHSEVGDNSDLAKVATLANEDVAIESTTTAVTNLMKEGGIDALMVTNGTKNAEAGATGGCAANDIGNSVLSRSNSLVAGNIFMSAHCGTSVSVSALDNIAVWTGGSQRITGQLDAAGAESAHSALGNSVYAIMGAGPSSNLFDPETYGSMTTVPVYRHVSGSDYNRFQAIFKVGTYDASGAHVAADGADSQATLIAIVDGAGDTKEEELGEWDGSRNTI